jgi:hypothetical protein
LHNWPKASIQHLIGLAITLTRSNSASHAAEVFDACASDVNLPLQSSISLSTELPASMSGQSNSTPNFDADKVALSDVWGHEACRGMNVWYRYDFGANWQHLIHFLGEENTGSGPAMAIP